MLLPASAALDQRQRTSTSSPRINPHGHKGRFEGGENAGVTRGAWAAQGEIELSFVVTAGQSRRSDKQPRSQRNAGGRFPLKQTAARRSRQEGEEPNACVCRGMSQWTHKRKSKRHYLQVCKSKGQLGCWGRGWGRGWGGQKERAAFAQYSLIKK